MDSINSRNNSSRIVVCWVARSPLIEGSNATALVRIQLVAVMPRHGTGNVPDKAFDRRQWRAASRHMETNVCRSE